MLCALRVVQVARVYDTQSMLSVASTLSRLATILSHAHRHLRDGSNEALVSATQRLGDICIDCRAFAI